MNTTISMSNAARCCRLYTNQITAGTILTNRINGIGPDAF